MEKTGASPGRAGWTNVPGSNPIATVSVCRACSGTEEVVKTSPSASSAWERSHGELSSGSPR